MKQSAEKIKEGDSVYIPIDQSKGKWKEVSISIPSKKKDGFWIFEFVGDKTPLECKSETTFDIIEKGKNK